MCSLEYTRRKKSTKKRERKRNWGLEHKHKHTIRSRRERKRKLPEKKKFCLKNNQHQRLEYFVCFHEIYYARTRSNEIFLILSLLLFKKEFDMYTFEERVRPHRCVLCKIDWL